MQKVWDKASTTLSKDAPQLGFLAFAYGTFQAPSYILCIMQEPRGMREQFIN